MVSHLYHWGGDWRLYVHSVHLDTLRLISLLLKIRSAISEEWRSIMKFFWCHSKEEVNIDLEPYFCIPRCSKYRATAKSSNPNPKFGRRFLRSGDDFWKNRTGIWKLPTGLVLYYKENFLGQLFAKFPSKTFSHS